MHKAEPGISVNNDATLRASTRFVRPRVQRGKRAIIRYQASYDAPPTLDWPCTMQKY